MQRQRDELGEGVSKWLAANPAIRVVETVVLLRGSARRVVGAAATLHFVVIHRANHAGIDQLCDLPAFGGPNGGEHIEAAPAHDRKAIVRIPSVRRPDALHFTDRRADPGGIELFRYTTVKQSDDVLGHGHSLLDGSPF